jgi:hypothetical protein
VALTALKGKTLKRKKAPAARRKLSGAAAAPMDDYNKCRDFFHFEVDNKDYAVIIKAYVKRVFDKEKARLILKNKEYNLYKSHVATFCHWQNAGQTAPESTIQYMTGYFENLEEQGKSIVEEIKAVEAEKPKNVYVPSIQERIKEASGNIIAEIEEAVDEFIADPGKFKGLDAVKLFRKLNVNQAHARHIRAFYEGPLAEYIMLQQPAREQDEDLREGYAHLDKAAIKRGVALFQGIVGACDLITQESKATRKTRSLQQPKSADKLVAKLKYCKTDEKYKVASINPVDIIGATELWVFNTKTRKLGKYVAEDAQQFQVKGTTLQFFNANASVAKTLRKPEQQLADFNKSGKVQLRKFLDDIKGVETKMNGRFNADTVILKAVK